MDFILDNGIEVCAKTGNYTMGCFGDTYFITNRAGKVLHRGKRKHIVEVWNTRYDYNHSRYSWHRVEQMLKSMAPSLF